MNENLTNHATEFGLNNFWAQSDGVLHVTALLLLIMSLLSWTQIILKGWRVSKRKRILNEVEMFWQESDIAKATQNLSTKIGSHPFADLAKQANSASKHFDEVEQGRGEHGINMEHSLSRNEFIARALRQTINRSTAKLESGLTMLASIGATAPFIGLFGTVYGIYNALLGVSKVGATSLSTVSGPVGEALIMTAGGLFVAIPAVLAYNTFIRLNRLELMELDGFAYDLHSYLNMGSKMERHKKGGK